MGVIPLSTDNAGYLADKYLGTKFDIIVGVHNALPWLETAMAAAAQANIDTELIEGYRDETVVMYGEITNMFGGLAEIEEAATYVTTKQAEIETSLFDMAYNLIRTQAIVAKYHAFT